VRPPSTCRSTPVMPLVRPLHSRTIASASSSGSSIRPIGCSARTAAMTSSRDWPVAAANVRALRGRAASSPALARYDEAARVLTGRPDAARADPLRGRRDRGGDHVDPDAVLRVGARQRLRPVDQGGLGRAVVRRLGARHEPVDRRDAHDRSAAAREHLGDRDAARAHGAEQVEFERGRPVRVRGVDRRGMRAPAADVVDEHVDAAGRLDEALGLAGAREVDLDPGHALDLGAARARARRDERALRGQRAGGHEPDSPARAGDDRVLAAQSEVHVGRAR